MANYPLPKFHFSVDWGGTRIGFTEITGLNLETKVIEYREGNMPEYNKLKMPGMREFGNITCKRGVMKKDGDFFAWFNTVSLNTIERRDLNVSLLDETHSPVMTWTIKNAWPVKLTSTDLKSDGNEVAIETLELAHEGLSIAAV